MVFATSKQEAMATATTTTTRASTDELSTDTAIYSTGSNNNNINNGSNNSNSSNDGEHQQHERYECPHPDCNKSFSRQEHLGRHKLNHWPKEIFTCQYTFPETGVSCGKTFVRKDLLVRHEKRHTKEKNRLHGKEKSKDNAKTISEISNSANNSPKKVTKRKTKKNIVSVTVPDATAVPVPKRKRTKKTTVKIDRSASVPITITQNPIITNTTENSIRDNLSQKFNSRSSVAMTNLNNGSNDVTNNSMGNIGTSFYSNTNNGSSSNFFDWLWAPDTKTKINMNLINGNSNNNNNNNNNNSGNNIQGNNVNNSNSMPNVNVGIPQQQQLPMQQQPIQQPIPSQMSHQMPHYQLQQMQMQQQQQQQQQQQNQMQPPQYQQHQQQQQHYPSQQVQQTPQQMSQQIGSQGTTPFGNPMTNPMGTPQDLFGVDYLNPDPLQHFMREINSSIFPFTSTNDESTAANNNNNENVNNNSVGDSISANVSPTNMTSPDRKLSSTEIPHGRINNVTNNFKVTQSLSDLQRHSSEPGLYSKISQDDTRRQSSSIDVSKDNTKVVPQAKLRYFDTRGEDVIDNLGKQKSNINDMRRQTSSPGSNSTETQQSRPLDIDAKIDDVMDSYKEQLKSSLNAIPSLFSSDPKTKYALSEAKCMALFQHIPDIKSIPQRVLQITLKSFWDNFQPKYGLLHKPSFQVNNEPDILILSLIMTGASYLGPQYRETISDPICGPLRWMIFSHPDFQPPSHTYIIQALLLLENYEKTCTNRYLHERSYLHHGTTMQLLRRTPSLGGHPLRDKKRHNHTDEGSHLDDFLSEEKIKNVVTRWVEFESLKRVAFFAFYMDVTHAVIFGYMNLFISFKQVHLELPCPDELWSSYDLSFEKLSEFGFFGDGTSNYKNITFLSALKYLIRDVLKKLDNKEVVDTSTNGKNGSVTGNDDDNEMSILFDNGNQSVFGKKILLAGILSMMFQCQEEAFDPLIGVGAFIKGIGEEITKTMTWREVMAFAINYWFCEIQQSCNETINCLTHDNTIDEDDEFANEPILQVCDWNRNELDCKLPVYHMSQVILRIFHHDYYIFAGVPWRMNVRVGETEFDSVYQKILNFAQDKYNGGVTLIYAYQFLFQMFIRVDKDDPTKITVDHSYDLNTDIYMTRPNTLALVTLLIWSLNFVLYGPEVNIWDNGLNQRHSISSCYSSDSDPKVALRNEFNQHLKQKYAPVESFDDYLIRMYKLLYIRDDQDVISFHNEIFQKANLVPAIPRKQNMCGFLMHIIAIFSTSYWDLGKEFNRLLENCLERSLGKSSHTCYNMYDV
ncbi:similar to Saccharomyces cerevisiae YPR022C Putative protein of unknown function [Maudiozyma saulgeensis]|uniref:C2H2-type domain-containing protein n=1 Tax=Maudiozyma saulgeensis TaxID=1789683 RepID=A0A1X7R1F9_9SACH|nr:similar to Saccharomyces cerevisiae YPR022C Putative protein of unknown function [Kazachstania saulgeensis]